MMNINTAQPSSFTIPRGNFTPPYVSQLDNSDDATKNFAQFYCYRLAKTFTDAFESESFQQEIAFSNMAEAIGKVLTESNIGLTLQENVTEMLNKNNGNTNVTAASAIKSVQSYQQPPLSSRDDALPAEMFEVHKWTA